MSQPSKSISCPESRFLEKNGTLYHRRFLFDTLIFLWLYLPFIGFWEKYLPDPAKNHIQRALQRFFAREFAGDSHRAKIIIDV